MAGPGNIVIRIGAETASAVAGIGSVNSALGETMTTGEKMRSGLKKAFVPAALALGGLAAAASSATKAAMEDAQGQAQLATALKNTTGAHDEQIKATEKWIDATSRAVGVADDQMRPALATIARSTGDVTKAQELMGTALDVSAATGKDLQSVSAAIAKGYSGQTAALGKLVPGISEAARSSKDFATIMDEVNQKTGGAAAANAETAAGSMAKLHVATSELSESLGYALLPALQAFIPIVSSAVAVATQHQTALKILIGIVGGLAAAIVTANVAMKAYAAAQLVVKAATAAWTAAQWLLNAALDANPIGIVILAIAALGTALVIAYQKSETFRAVVNAAFAAVKVAAAACLDGFNALKNGAVAAADFIASHWRAVAVVAFGPLGAAIVVAIDHFNTLKSIAIAVADALTSAFNAVTGAINAAISAVESLIGWLGKVHVPHISIPNPFGASAGYPSSFAARSGAGGGRASSSGLTINVYGTVDPEGTARSINRILRAHDRRQGRTL